MTDKPGSDNQIPERDAPDARTEPGTGEAPTEAPEAEAAVTPGDAGDAGASGDGAAPEPEGSPEEAAAEAAPPPDHPVLAGLAAAVPAARFSQSHGDDVAHVDPADLVAFATACREAGYEMFVDLAAVDYLTRRPRFEVVVNLLSLAHSHRLRIRVGVSGDDPVVPSITAVYPGANFYEREAYDLFGVEFSGHPDLTRILLPDDWEGHPLRKDATVGSVPVQFKEAHKAR